MSPGVDSLTIDIGHWSALRMQLRRATITRMDEGQIRVTVTLTQDAFRRHSVGRILLLMSLDMSASRDPIRVLVETTIPDGIIWLPTDALPHPEAARASELPFVFEVGRISTDGKTVTVREAELVAATLDPDDAEPARLMGLLQGYARYVIAKVPTRHARLTGRAVIDWVASDAKSRSPRS